MYEKSRVDSRTPTVQEKIILVGDVLSERPPAMTRPIANTIKYLENLSGKHGSGKKRHLQGKVKARQNLQRWTFYMYEGHP